MTGTRRKRRSTWVLMALAVATLIAGGLDVVVRLGAQGVPVTPGQALARYRAAVGGSAAPSPAVPHPPSRPGIAPVHGINSGAGVAIPPGWSGNQRLRGSSRSHAQPLPHSGVYLYDTTGYEQVAVPGSRRAFPHHTAITIQPSGCGVVETWQPFQQHTERTTVCAGTAGSVLASYYVSVSFYGQTDTTSVTCAPDAYLYPTGAGNGRTWTYTCSSAQTSARNQARIIGYQSLSVHGQPIRTVHVHVDTVTSGPNGGGSSPADYWFATSNGLLIRNAGTVQSNGTAHYFETYDLQLADLQPKT